jgi:hypothetical protein
MLAHAFRSFSIHLTIPTVAGMAHFYSRHMKAALKYRLLREGLARQPAEHQTSAAAPTTAHSFSQAPPLLVLPLHAKSLSFTVS